MATPKPPYSSEDRKAVILNGVPPKQKPYSGANFEWFSAFSNRQRQSHNTHRANPGLKRERGTKRGANVTTGSGENQVGSGPMPGRNKKSLIKSKGTVSRDDVVKKHKALKGVRPTLSPTRRGNVAEKERVPGKGSILEPACDTPAIKQRPSPNHCDRSSVLNERYYRQMGKRSSEKN